MWELEGVVCVAVIIILFAYFAKRGCDKNNSEGKCEVRPCTRLLKRDFKYSVSILLGLIVLLITSKFGNNIQLQNYISFGSTLSSIILSVLAIFMTMLSESKSDATKTRLENLTSLIETASSSTRNQVKKITKIYKSMEERYETYEKILEKQDELISKLEALDERTKNIEEGIVKSNYKNESNKWANKKMIVREDNGPREN